MSRVATITASTHDAGRTMSVLDCPADHSSVRSLRAGCVVTRRSCSWPRGKGDPWEWAGGWLNYRGEDADVRGMKRPRPAARSAAPASGGRQDRSLR